MVPGSSGKSSREALRLNKRTHANMDDGRLKRIDRHRNIVATRRKEYVKRGSTVKCSGSSLKRGSSSRVVRSTLEDCCTTMFRIIDKKIDALQEYDTISAFSREDLQKQYASISLLNENFSAHVLRLKNILLQKIETSENELSGILAGSEPSVHTDLNAHEQSSSSIDDKPNIKTEYPSPKINFATEKQKGNKVCGFDLLGKVSLDQLMTTKAELEAAKRKERREESLTELNDLISGIRTEILRYLGSMKAVEKQTIFGSMDRLISMFTKDYQKFNKPGIADFSSDFLRSSLHSYKYLFRSHEKRKRYYKRITRILAIYTDLVLYASLRGNEYDRNVANQLALTYQIYLDDNLLVLNILLHSRRLCRLHRGILVLIFEHFLVPKTSNKYPDIIFMKYLCLYKKWIYIEEVDCQKIRDAFIKFIKPKKTLCTNSLFKPYLPVDGEGFVTIDNIDDILNMEYSHTNLVRCIQKSEQTPSAAGQVGEVIVLTDDEPDYDGFSKPGTSSMAVGHPDDS